MKKIFLFVLCVVAVMLTSTSCRFARVDNLGDTVAAIEFDPTIGSSFSYISRFNRNAISS